MSRPTEETSQASTLTLRAERAPDPKARMRRIAILGNPNAGKSTLFNRLTGLRQKVGNYPGVTVEKKTGRCELPSGAQAELIDLPGTYSLQPASPDEQIVRDVLLGLQSDTPPPDLIVLVVDATHLERHLNLALQVIELGRPVVLTLNMMDSAREQGLNIDIESLQRGLGVPVIPISAATGEGLGPLRRVMEREVEPSTRHFREWPIHLQKVLVRLAARLPRQADYPDRTRRDIAFALLLDDGEDDSLARAAAPELLEFAAAQARELDRNHPGWRHQDVEVRFGAIREILAMAMVTPGHGGSPLRARLDRILTHRELVKKHLEEYRALLAQQPMPGVEAHCIFDTEQDEYLLVEWGWDEKKRVRRVILFVRLLEGKIWIEEDWTEEGSAQELLNAGVARSEIVLAFQHPSMRDVPQMVAA